MNTITPEEVGFSSARLERLSNAMRGYVDQNIVIGLMVALARRGQVFHFDCLGLMDREANKAMQPETIFRIYSMTKPVTSVALLMLYEEGRILLNEPVSKYIPEFKDLMVMVGMGQRGPAVTDMEREITIRDLLTHTAGLSYGLFDDSPLEELYRQTEMASPTLNLQVSLAEMVQILAQLPLAHQPGSAWRYSMATDVIGYLVGLIADMPFDTFLQERIFDPLGMEDTGFYVPPEKIERFAAMYGPTEKSRLDLIDAPATSSFLNQNYNPSGGGGLVSTMADYLRFTRMLLGGGQLDGTRLLGPQTVAMMRANHLPNEVLPLRLGNVSLPGYGFGLGVRVMLDVPQSGVLGSTGEYGWAGAASTYFWIDPQQDLIGILMTQFLPSSLFPVPIRDLLRTLTYQALVE